jgi:hypothetical protein
MPVRNNITQELFTRDAQLYSEILGVLLRRADPFGNAWVEIVNGEETPRGEDSPPLEIRVHTRYSEDGQDYEITQIVRMDCQYSLR